MIWTTYIYFPVNDDRNRASGKKRVRVFTAAGNCHL
jgi:hypothetical protein